ncbi:hypothetical protein M9Y10_015286 [Tritrichomonas musculus]|uniref:Uncharacterized protein n=1 Tax=Tritrichomonas musculus TaxID=1915356 RepID=A0ABR2L1X1_9EUKA
MNYRIKIILLGDSSVGKTCLLKRYINNEFRETPSTIGVDFVNKQVEINSEAIDVRIWDTAGQEKYSSLIQTYFVSTDGAIIVFDLTSRQSYENAQSWIDKLVDMLTYSPAMILVGNKCDLSDQREILVDEAINLAKRNNIQYIETSALTGANVKELFNQIESDSYANKKKRGSQNGDDLEKISKDTNGCC